MNRNRQIRVGVIRCDLHAFYYGALMFRHDPIALRDDQIGRGHAAYFYFYLHYDDPAKITVPTVDGFRLVKVWDENRQLAEAMSNMFDDHPAVCGSFEEVSDGVDLVYVADCNGDGSDHLKLAAPGLEKGVPTFVDKPFAYEVKDARALVELAESSKAPVMSFSMLRMLPHATRFRDRFVELDSPKFGIIKGGDIAMAGHIHAISLAQYLFGNGVESVECMGQTPLAYVHLDYGKKSDRPSAGVILCCASGPTYHCSMYASAYSERGAIHSSNLGDFEFPWAAAKILEMAKEMVYTRESQASYEEMVESIAIATAARLSQKEHRRVCLREV